MVLLILVIVAIIIIKTANNISEDHRIRDVEVAVVAAEEDEVVVVAVERVEITIIITTSTMIDEIPIQRGIPNLKCHLKRRLQLRQHPKCRHRQLFNRLNPINQLLHQKLLISLQH